MEHREFTGDRRSEEIIGRPVVLVIVVKGVTPITNPVHLTIARDLLSLTNLVSVYDIRLEIVDIVLM